MKGKFETISKKLSKSGDSVVITRQLEEELNEQDIIQRKNKCIVQQLNIQKQMEQFKYQYEIVTATIVECDEVLQQFSKELPDIES